MGFYIRSVYIIGNSSNDTRTLHIGITRSGEPDHIQDYSPSGSIKEIPVDFALDCLKENLHGRYITARSVSDIMNMAERMIQVKYASYCERKDEADEVLIGVGVFGYGITVERKDGKPLSGTHDGYDLIIDNDDAKTQDVRHAIREWVNNDTGIALCDYLQDVFGASRLERN